MSRAVVLAALLVATLPVQAQVYKCQKEGKTVFSDQPCNIDSLPVIPARADVPPPADTDELRRSAVSKVEMAAVTSISILARGINSSASATKDAWKVTLLFRDRNDKSVSLSETDGIRYTATVYEDRDGERGPVLGRASGSTVRDYTHYFIVKLATRLKTKLLTEAAVTLPDGRRFDAVDRSTFNPGPL